MQLLYAGWALSCPLVWSGVSATELPRECSAAPLAELELAAKWWPARSASPPTGHGLVRFSVRTRRSGKPMLLTRAQDWEFDGVVAWNFEIVMDLLQRAVARWPDAVPGTDLAISVTDMPSSHCPDEPRFPCFGFCAPYRGAANQSSSGTAVALPSDGRLYIGWPSPYFLRHGFVSLAAIDMDKKLPHADAVPWEDRINKIYWRGTLSGPDEESDIEQFTRTRLLRLVERRPLIFDAGITGIDDSTPAIEHAGAKAVKRRYRKFMLRADRFSESLPKYKYLLSIEGVAASWRGRELFAAGSVVLLQRGRWVEFFDASLKPFVHYVPIESDLSDLEQRFVWLEANPDKAKELADAASEFSRTSLLPLQTECYALAALQFTANTVNYPPLSEDELRSAGYVDHIPTRHRKTDL